MSIFEFGLITGLFDLISWLFGLIRFPIKSTHSAIQADHFFSVQIPTRSPEQIDRDKLLELYYSRGWW
jgi:hypothetical protein